MGRTTRLQQISRTLDEHATRVEGLAQQLGDVVGELRADDLPAEKPVHLPERRSGSDRRTGLERRRAQPEGEGSAAGSQDDAAPGVVRQG